MGKRGSGSGMSTGGSRDGVIGSAAPREIETTYHTRTRYYNQNVLEATTDGSGNLTFSRANGTFSAPSAKTNTTVSVTYKVTAGAINGETFNINWDNVNSISGETYALRKAAKDHGLKWDGNEKKWRR